MTERGLLYGLSEHIVFYLCRQQIGGKQGVD